MDAWSHNMSGSCLGLFVYSIYDDSNTNQVNFIVATGLKVIIQTLNNVLTS